MLAPLLSLSQLSMNFGLCATSPCALWLSGPIFFSTELNISLYSWENFRTKGAEALPRNLRPEHSQQSGHLDSPFSAPSLVSLLCAWRLVAMITSLLPLGLTTTMNGNTCQTPSQISSRCPMWNKKHYSWTIIIGFPLITWTHPQKRGQGEAAVQKPAGTKKRDRHI